VSIVGLFDILISLNAKPVSYRPLRQLTKIPVATTKMNLYCVFSNKHVGTM
jgi:hypothetical protein